MGYLSSRRGVISVFLLIIFMITYVFMGMLVDAGRYRMAQTYMESALDSASSSVLSSYNKLVFDLYGLFSTDITIAEGETMESKIEALYNGYLQETLGIIDVDTEQYSTLLNNVLHADEDKNVLTTKSLYDFQITELDAGTSVTLANTSNVENQIIEYMKFRAPVELMGEVEGFVNILKTITDMESSVQAAQDRHAITKEFENDEYSVSEAANKVLLRVDSLMKDIKNNTGNVAEEGRVYSLYGNLALFDATYIPAYETYFKEVNGATLNFFSALRDELERLRVFINENAQTITVPDWENGMSVSFHTIENLSDYNVTEFVELKCDSVFELWDLQENVVSNAQNYKNAERLLYLASVVSEQVEDWLKNGTGKGDDKKFLEELKGYQESIAGVYSAYSEVVTPATKNYEEAKERAFEHITAIETKEQKLNKLYKDAYEGENSVRKDLEAVEAKYKEYIGKLEAKKEATTIESEKAVFDTEILQIKSNAFLICERLELLNSIEPYLKFCGVSVEGSHLLSVSAESYKKSIISEAENSDTGRVGSLCEKFGFEKKDQGKLSEEAKNSKLPAVVTSSEELLEGTQKSYYTLLELASNYKAVGKPETEDEDVEKVKEQKMDTDAVQKEAEKKAAENNKAEAETEAVALVHEKFTSDMLKVNYQSVASSNSGYTLQNCSIGDQEELDESVFDKLLSVASSLITQLGNMFEGARDNLYVDAYIMSTFPNYYSHYQKRAEGDNAKDKLFSGVYKDYNASLAEVEYIITGGGDNTESWSTNPAEFGTDSVEAFKGKLFGFRLMMNAISMFTDPGRYSQAMSISSWAGVFAPLVACVLMIAWTVAETALDVLVLTGEGGWIDDDGCVPVYKSSSQWYISVGGVLEALVNAGIDAVAEKVLSGADALVTSAETKVNAVMYDVYEAINNKTVENLDEVFSMVETKGNEVLTEWSGELKENINNAMDDTTGNSQLDPTAKQTVSSGMEKAEEQISKQFLNTIESGKDKIASTVEDVTDNFKEQAVMAVSNVKNMVMEQVEASVNGVTGKAKSFVSDNISKIVPSSSTATAECKIELSYEHHLYLFLFLMDSETKIQRVQAVIQANMQVGGQTSFKMENAPVAVWADLECSMKYMFISNGLVPESMKRDGRLRLKVISAQSY